MNQIDLEEFNRLEKLLNENVISPIDFWQRIRELKSIQIREVNKIQKSLFTLEAKQFTSKIDLPERQKYNFAEDITLLKDLSAHTTSLKENSITNAQSIMEAVERMKNIPIPQVPFFQTSNSDPLTRSHYIEPRTTGEKMLKKIGYTESVDEYDTLITGYFPKNIRIFERIANKTIDYIEFSKSNGETSFISYSIRKSNTFYQNEREPKYVAKNELEAIIQIITEWMD